VVTICTAQWSLFVPHSGHYLYRRVVTICTAEWSLYVPHSGHYLYRTVVAICTAQWSLYVPHSGHYMYHTVVTIGTTSLTFNSSMFCPHTVFVCFVWISEQTAIISLYNINWLVFVTEMECVYCAVRTGSLYITQVAFAIQCVHKIFIYISKRAVITKTPYMNTTGCHWAFRKNRNMSEITMQVKKERWNFNPHV